MKVNETTMPIKILFGNGSINNMGEEAHSLGDKRISALREQPEMADS